MHAKSLNQQAMDGDLSMARVGLLLASHQSMSMAMQTVHSGLRVAVKPTPASRMFSDNLYPYFSNTFLKFLVWVICEKI